MPRIRVLVRLLGALTASIGALIAVFVVAIFSASPAYAADAIEVELRGPSQATPGRAAGMSVSLENTTEAEITRVRTVFVVRLDGASAGDIRVSRGALPLASSGSSGEFRFTDALQGRLAPDGDNGDSTNTSYSIFFSNDVPRNRADVTVEAQQDGKRLGSDSISISMRGGNQEGPRTTTKSTPPNTDPGLVPSFDYGPTVDVKPLDNTSPLANIDPGFPPILYLMGAVLLAVGGVLLWLLYRGRDPQPAMGDPTAEHPLVLAGGALPGHSLPRRTLANLRGGGGKGVHNPTMVLPTVRNPRPGPNTPPHTGSHQAQRQGPNQGQRAHQPPPPVDPWAGQNRPPDPTREFDPFI